MVLLIINNWVVETAEKENTKRSISKIVNTKYIKINFVK